MQCETCGSNQKSDAELKIHQKMFHQKIQCNCDNCSYTAIGEYDLKEHNQKSHNNLINFKCTKAIIHDTSQTN